jgi:hypothetical protein
MPALLINLKIDVLEKFEFFKVTLADLSGLFEECHIKIRGAYSQECTKYAQDKLGSGICLYQELQEEDWVAATLEMLSHVASRSVFLYFEDHRLVASRQELEQTLADFDKCNLDYLCYSFFRASQLGVNNLLPLGVTKRKLFHEFTLNDSNLSLIGKLSPGYYTFSLVSLVSVNCFREHLLTENKKIKIFNRKITSIITLLFSYPRYKKVFNKINHVFSSFGARVCIYPPSSPFNLEKIWFEPPMPNHDGWKFGILKQELFANYDDDNGAYGESLIKRGLYPFEVQPHGADSTEHLNNVLCQIALNEGEFFDCTYYSHKSRIRRAPQVEISVVSGRVVVLYQGASFPLSSGGAKFFYSNLGPVIQCVEPSEVQIKVFDEAF